MMGDMADALTEQGFDNIAAHQAGQCDYGCRECHDEDEKREKQRKAAAKRRAELRRQRSPKGEK